MNGDTGFIPVIRRWWWLLLLGTLAAAIAANVVARNQSPTYASSATLLVGPLNADYATTQAAGDLGRTYADLAKTLPVVAGAVQRANVAIKPVDLQKKVSATSNDVTRLVTVRVEAAKAPLAATLANAIGAQLIGVSQAVTPQETDAVRAFMSQREIQRLPAATQDAVHAAAVRVFGAGLSGRLRMMAPAVPAVEPAAPNVPLLTTLGALAGLALAAVAALVASADRRREGADVQSTRAIPFLGTIAAAHRASDAGYRLLAAKIGLFSDDRLRTVAVVGAGGRAPAGAVATSLARTLADGGLRTLVVDASDGTATRLLELDGRPGYGELVRSDAAIVSDDLRVACGDGLFALPAGANGSTRLLDRERADRLLAAFEEAADVVVLSVPPTHVSPVGLVWASLAQATLVVGESGDPRAHDAVDETVESLQRVGANVLGTVAGRNGRAWPRVRAGRAKARRAAVTA